MNDNQPQPPSSFPLEPDEARNLANVLASADGSTSLERILGELRLLVGYEVVGQENGMVSLSRVGGEGSLLLIPTASFIPMMAETILKFMVPSALHHLLAANLDAAQIALVLRGGSK